MTIKRRTLIILIIMFAIAALVASFTISNYMKERDRQREIDAYFECLEKQTEREYESLKCEYQSYVETIMDNEYSYELRAKYVRKVNKLLDEYIYEYESFSSGTVFNFMEAQPLRHNEDLKILHKLAEERVFQD